MPRRIIHDETDSESLSEARSDSGEEEVDVDAEDNNAEEEEVEEEQVDVDDEENEDGGAEVCARCYLCFACPAYLTPRMRRIWTSCPRHLHLQCLPSLTLVSR